MTAKPATAARIYDYFLGGVHNFPADREAAERIIEQFPDVPLAARTNRAFLGRAVRCLAGAGIRQFLDVGSGVPTQGNVHEIAQSVAPGSRVVYVDIDPVAVGESLDLLAGNPDATAVRADLRDPKALLANPTVTRLLDLGRPVGLLLAAVLHFVPDDDEAYGLVADLVDGLPAGSHVVVSHIALESFVTGDMGVVTDVYRQRTSTPTALRTRDGVARFFTGLDLLEPGVVWVSEWRPEPGEPDPVAGQPRRSCGWAAVGVKP